jgi:hypothetical protein
MKELDILILFVFVLSCIFTVNQIFKVVTNIFSDEPKQIIYNWTEKVSNYFFISYLITYLIIKFI